MLIWCPSQRKKCLSLSSGLFVSKDLRLPSRVMQTAWKKQGRQHILQRLKICQIPPPWLAVFWRVMSFQELLEEFIWMMSYEERKGFVLRESPVSTSRLSETGLGPAKFRSGLRRLRVGLRTPVFNLEWVTAIFLRPMSPPRGSGKQPWPLLSQAVSILTRVFVAPIRNKRLCCYFPDDCVLMISFLTQAEKLQFHKAPVILINVLPGLSVAELLSKLFCQ